MEEKELPPWRSEVVVHSHDVERYNQLGYQTVQVLDEQIWSPVNLSDQVVSSGSSYPVNVMKQELAVTKVLKFLMVRDGASHVAKLSDDLTKKDSSLTKAEFALRDAKKESTELRIASDNLTRDIERRRVELDQKNVESADQRKRLQKMEADIAKIRGAIGDLKMKEILGESTK